MNMTRTIIPPQEKIDHNYYIDTKGCWIWIGRLGASNRPIISMETDRHGDRKVTTYMVHVYLYEQMHGPLTVRYLDNICGNNLCISPEHHVPRTFENRLWNNLYKSDSGCWEWQGHIDAATGYGTITVDKKSKLVHRVAYEEYNKITIPDGLQICHRCNNKKCINPEHLYMGTHNDNMRDMANSNILKGEDNPNSSLTKIDVLEIKSLIKSRMITYQKIANQFGVSRQAIKDIALGRTWKWLE